MIIITENENVQAILDIIQIGKDHDVEITPTVALALLEKTNGLKIQKDNVMTLDSLYTALMNLITTNLVLEEPQIKKWEDFIQTPMESVV